MDFFQDWYDQQPNDRKDDLVKVWASFLEPPKIAPQEDESQYNPQVQSTFAKDLVDFFSPRSDTNPLSQTMSRYSSDVAAGVRDPRDLPTTQEAVGNLIRKPLGHINEFLDWFDKFRNAPTTAAYNALRSTNPDETAWQGLKSGWQQKELTHLTDLLGIRRPMPDDPMWEWLLRAGAQIGGDVISDPLNLLFGLGAVRRGGSLLGKAVHAALPWLPAEETLAGNLIRRTPIPQIGENLYLKSGLNRAFGHSAGEAQEIIDRARWGGASTERFTREQLGKIAGELERLGVKPNKEALEEWAIAKSTGEAEGASPQEAYRKLMLDVYHGLERPQERSADIPAKVWDMFTPMREKESELFTRRNVAREAHDLDPVSDISTPGVYDYMVHLFKGEKPPWLYNKPAVREWSTAQPQSRELFRWVKEGTDEDVIPGFVSSAEDKYLKLAGIKGNPRKGYTYKGEPVNPEPVVAKGYNARDVERALDFPELGAPTKGQEFVDLYPKPTGGRVKVEPTPQVSLKEIMEAPNLKIQPSRVVSDPAQALSQNVNKLQREVNFWEAMQKLEESGMIRKLEPVEEGAEPVKQSVGDWLRGLTREPEYRQVGVRGLEGYEAHPRVADYLENWAHAAIDPSTPIGKVAEAMEAFRGSRLGEDVHRLNTWWKRNILASLRRGVSDELSRWPQLYGQAEMSFPEIAKGHYDFGKLWFPEHFEEIKPGVPNTVMRDALEDREAMGQSFAGQWGRQEVGRMPSWWRGLSEDHPWSAPVTRRIARFGEAVGDINDMVLGAIRRSEEQHKGAAILNWIDRFEEKGGRSLGDIYRNDPEMFERVMDKAARRGHDTMGDYTRMGTTPFERSMIELFPFYRWLRYIIPGGIETAVSRPQRLGNLGRFYNTLFEPMSEEEYKKMPEWAKEQGMFKRFLGWTPNEWKRWMGSEVGDKDTAFTIGRLIPYQHHGELMLDPVRALETKLSPWLKMFPEWTTNTNKFIDRPIDESAGGPLNSIFQWSKKGLGMDYEPFDYSYQRLFGQKIPAGLDYFLGQSPLSQRRREWDELARGIAHSLGAEPHTGLFQDPTRPPVNWWEAMLYAGSGRRPYTFDFEKQERAETWKQGKFMQHLQNNLKAAKRAGDTDKQEAIQEMIDRYKGRHPDAPTLVTFPKKGSGRTSGPVRSHGVGDTIDMKPKGGKWTAPEEVPQTVSHPTPYDLDALIQEIQQPTHDESNLENESKDDKKYRRKMERDRRENVLKWLEYYQ